MEINQWQYRICSHKRQENRNRRNKNWGRVKVSDASGNMICPTISALSDHYVLCILTSSSITSRPYLIYWNFGKSYAFSPSVTHNEATTIVSILVESIPSSANHGRYLDNTFVSFANKKQKGSIPSRKDFGCEPKSTVYAFIFLVLKISYALI